MKVGDSIGSFTCTVSFKVSKGLKIMCQKRTRNSVLSTAVAADFAPAGKLDLAIRGSLKLRHSSTWYGDSTPSYALLLAKRMTKPPDLIDHVVLLQQHQHASQTQIFQTTHGTSKVAMQALDCTNCFSLVVGEELDHLAMDELVFIYGHGFFPEDSILRYSECSSHRGSKTWLVVLQEARPGKSRARDLTFEPTVSMRSIARQTHSLYDRPLGCLKAG